LIPEQYELWVVCVVSRSSEPEHSLLKLAHAQLWTMFAMIKIAQVQLSSMITVRMKAILSASRFSFEAFSPIAFAHNLQYFLNLILILNILEFNITNSL
jgi:hypothetical protein